MDHISNQQSQDRPGQGAEVTQPYLERLDLFALLHLDIGVFLIASDYVGVIDDFLRLRQRLRESSFDIPQDLGNAVSVWAM